MPIHVQIITEKRKWKLCKMANFVTLVVRWFRFCLIVLYCFLTKEWTYMHWSFHCDRPTDCRKLFLKKTTLPMRNCLVLQNKNGFSYFLFMYTSYTITHSLKRSSKYSRLLIYLWNDNNGSGFFRLTFLAFSVLYIIYGFKWEKLFLSLLYLFLFSMPVSYVDPLFIPLDFAKLSVNELHVQSI